VRTTNQAALLRIAVLVVLRFDPEPHAIAVQKERPAAASIMVGGLLDRLQRTLL
jgi:hypothetical protein